MLLNFSAQDFLRIFVFAEIVFFCFGYHFDKCELAKVLLHKHKLPQNQINDWLCLVEGESQFNSSAVGNLNSDGSKDLGIFQISDKYWCEWGKPRSTGCKLKCEDLIDDDVSDDVKCVKEIYDEHKRLSGNGFNAWVAWKVKCEGQNLSHFTQDCVGLKTSEEDTTTTTSDEEKAQFKFRPGIVSPAYDENESKLYKIV